MYGAVVRTSAARALRKMLKATDARGRAIAAGMDAHLEDLRARNKNNASFEKSITVRERKKEYG